MRSIFKPSRLQNLTSRLFTSRQAPPSIVPWATQSISRSLVAPRLCNPITKRNESSLTVPASEQNKAPAAPVPSYQLTFTCKPCNHRSSHRVTKHGYHKGTTLIQCPNCKSRHVISDHLNIFMDEKSDLEDILRRKAGPGSDLSKLLKKGKLGMRDGQLVANEGEEEIEFWDDGTESQHQAEKS